MGPGISVSTGNAAEQTALNYLSARDLRPVARNFRCRGGEIDLIMFDDDCLVFVEVRYRASSSFSPASHTVDARKQAKIIRSAAMFLSRNPRLANRVMRFDVVAIDANPADSITWIKDAFRVNNSVL